MNQASRIRLAKQLIHCARMVLDTKQFRQAKNITAYASTEIKQLIYQIDKTLVRYIKKYGVQDKINNSGFVIHHFKFGNRKPIITNSITDATISKIKKAIKHHNNSKTISNDKTDQLQQFYQKVVYQIKHIVLIPAWFHDKFHRQGALWRNLRTRQAYYIMMGQILKNPDSYEQIAELRFDDTNLHSALRSLATLALTVNENYKENVINLLKEDYKSMKQQIIEYYKKHRL